MGVLVGALDFTGSVRVVGEKDGSSNDFGRDGRDVRVDVDVGDGAGFPAVRGAVGVLCL